MANPWDRTPIPSHGAIVDNHLYLEMGRSLSAWEEYEIDLSWLYAVLAGLPLHSTESYRSYIEKADNFSQRAIRLEDAARQYFTRSPNQSDEGDFCEIVRFARGWSARRNDIAHSVVRPMPRQYDSAAGTGFDEWINRADEYLLYPPDYAAKKFNSAGAPAYAYGVTELRHFAAAFRQLSPHANRLSLRLVERRS